MTRKYTKKADSPLPTELLGLLGTASDRELARRYSIPLHRIRSERLSRGIASSRQLDLPTQLLGLLGTASDRELARRFSISMHTIRRERLSRGIACFSPNHHDSIAASDAATTRLPAILSEDQTRLLGTMADVALSRLTGVSNLTIGGLRRELGIPPYRPVISWSEEQNRLLGTMHDVALAKQFGLTNYQVRDQRIKLGIAVFSDWTAGALDMLGKVPDLEIVQASEGKLTLPAVRAKRRKLGISVVRGPKPVPKGSKVLQPDIIDLLGVVNDYEIARRTGLDRSLITHERLKLGVKAVNRGRPGRKWSEEEDALINAIPDAEIASRLLVTMAMVRVRRRQLGVLKPCNRASPRSWTAAEDALLGTRRDSEVAKELGCSFGAVWKRRVKLQKIRSQIPSAPPLAHI